MFGQNYGFGSLTSEWRARNRIYTPTNKSPLLSKEDHLYKPNLCTPRNHVLFQHCMNQQQQSQVNSVGFFVWFRSFEVKELIIFDKLSPKSSKSNMWAPVSWVEQYGVVWVSMMEPDIASPRTTSVSFPQGFAPWLTIPSIGFHISLEMEDVLRLPKSTSDLSKGVHRLFLKQQHDVGKVCHFKLLGKLEVRRPFGKNDGVTNVILTSSTFQHIHLQVQLSWGLSKEYVNHTVRISIRGEIISIAPCKGHS